MADTKQLIIELSLQNDKLKKELNDVGKAGKKVGAKLKQSFIAAGAAIVATIAITKKLIGLYAKQEQAEIQLAARIKSTGGAAGLTAKELKKMASELQSVTTFGDEAIIESQALLLTFTKIGKDVFPKATEAILNLSQATGQDLKSSTIQLGKALNDPVAGIGALSRVGIQLSDDQKKQIKTFTELNNVAGAQQVILKELKTQFGGAARAATQGTGAFKQLGNELGDVGEELGKGLVPIIKEFLPFLRNFIKGFQSLPKGLKVTASAVFALAPAFIALNASLGPVGLAITGLVIGLTLIATKLASTRVEIDELEKRQAKLALVNDELTNSIENLLAAYGDIHAISRKRIKEIDAEIKSTKENVEQGKNLIGTYNILLGKYYTKADYEKATVKANMLIIKLEKEKADIIKNGGIVVEDTIPIIKDVNKLTDEEIILIQKLIKTQEDALAIRLVELKAISTRIDLSDAQRSAINAEIKVIETEIEARGKLNNQLDETLEKTEATLSAIDTQITKSIGGVQDAFNKYKETANDTSATAIDKAGGIVGIIQGILQLVKQLGNNFIELGENIQTSERFIKKFGKTAAIELGSASKALGGFLSNFAEGAKKGIPTLTANIILSVKKIKSEANQAVNDSNQELLSSLATINEEIARNEFALSRKRVDDAEQANIDIINSNLDASIKSAAIETGLTKILGEEEEDRVDDLKDQLENATTAEEKSDITRQLNKINALKLYNSKKSALEKQAETDRITTEAAADLERQEIRREEYLFDLALRKAEIDGQRESALANAEGIIGKDRREKAQIRIEKSFASISAKLDSIPVPTFAQGGMIRGLPNIGPEDGFIAAQNGESVLNRRATAELGEATINALNSGRGASPSNVTINVQDGRGAVKILDDYFKTEGSSSRGIRI